MPSTEAPAVITSSKPARPQAWKERRHQQILDAAFEEFAERGYESTRLDDVAKRAGIAKGTIYLYFENKELLFRAVLRDQITHVLSDFEAYAEGSSSSAEELLRELLVRQYAELVGNPKARAIIRLLISESRKFPQLSEIYYNDIVLPGMRTIRHILEKGASEALETAVPTSRLEPGTSSSHLEPGTTTSHLQPGTLMQLPQILIAPAILAVLWSLIFGDRHPLDFEAYREAHLQFVLSGMRGSLGAAPLASDGGREPE